MSKICLCWAEIGMNGSFSKGAEYLNCNDHLTARGQKHVDSTAGYLPVYSPRLLLILMSLAVPKEPRKDYFSSQSVKCFLFRVKCDWFRVIEKFGAKYCGRKQSSSLEPFEFSLGSRCRRQRTAEIRFPSCFLIYSSVPHGTIMSGEDSFRYYLNVKKVYLLTCLFWICAR